jgi:hypothetical protein
MHAPSDQASAGTVADTGCVKDFDSGPCPDRSSCSCSIGFAVANGGGSSRCVRHGRCASNDPGGHPLESRTWELCAGRRCTCAAQGVGARFAACVLVRKSLIQHKHVTSLFRYVQQQAMHSSSRSRPGARRIRATAARYRVQARCARRCARARHVLGAAHVRMTRSRRGRSRVQCGGCDGSLAQPPGRSGICALAAIWHGERRSARDRASPRRAAKTARCFKRKSVDGSDKWVGITGKAGERYPAAATALSRSPLHSDL